MINIGLLGLGTVGQGVVEIVNSSQEELKKLVGEDVNVKKILVKNKDKERSEEIPKEKITYRVEEILEDKDIMVVIEATSDVEESYKNIRKALEQGKHVVTANKAIVSKYFEELSNLAKEKDRAFLYEASVGGGIPILKPLKEEIALNDISHIQGILNGTSNYILTRMFEEGLDYGETLKIAQDLGYAEANPSSDVDGYDTQRKLRILSTIGLKGEVKENDVLVRGISSISSFDVEQIKKLGYTVKLIGETNIIDEKFTAVVEPVLLRSDSYFANVNMAFNAISLEGNNVGELKFFGAGAGKLPTANAVLKDVIDILKGTYRKKNILGSRKLKNRNEEIKGKYYLRISLGSGEIPEEIKGLAEKILDPNFAAITREVEFQEVDKLLANLNIQDEKYFLARIQD
ncbi:MAG: homoserine dehydrogenase [Tissierellaceae bacterium]|nr:homoserine dehydrogenase [Tissierellaceae bacterium]